MTQPTTEWAKRNKKDYSKLAIDFGIIVLLFLIGIVAGTKVYLDVMYH